MNFIQQDDSEDFYLAKIGDHVFVLEECKDFPKGLSHREHLLENEGMLFNFNDPGDRTFHMRDCLIPLDILFIKDGKVNKIYHECQPCKIDECDKYIGEADSVVELLGGTCKKNNISEGLIYRHF
jgi:uncharacterized membrane protein (UPF0127 family)